MTAKKVSETLEHKRLKEAVKVILDVCRFNVDCEVALNFTGNTDEDGEYIDERSIDVAAYGIYKEKKFLFIFECKGGKNFGGINKDISAWESDISKLRGKGTRIVYSEDSKIREQDISELDEIRVCYVFGQDLDKEKYRSVSSALKKRRIFSWDAQALAFYQRIAGTVGKWIRYDIFKEFGVNFESSGMWSEKAIRIKQGKHELFVMCAYPSVLLKIGYVSRRASGKPEAYQRILSKDRIDKISEFVTSRSALLPNAIIIAFDQQPEVQKKITFSDGILSFPKIYCSAWIIDGQHRVFGFMGTKYENVDPDDPSEDFRLPVVAFKKLDPFLQNQTFVSINYFQKKIDPSLLCDLATSAAYLQNELTWPSRLASALNEVAPLKGKIKISELDNGTISLSSFARYALLESLLGYDSIKKQYNGPLFLYFSFNQKASLENAKNKTAFQKQKDLLLRYFHAVSVNVANRNANKNPWLNTKEYALLKPTGINALLLVLTRIMERHPTAGLDFNHYLKPLKSVSFKKDYVAKQGGGWKGFRGLANIIIRKLNQEHTAAQLRPFGKKEKI